MMRTIVEQFEKIARSNPENKCLQVGNCQYNYGDVFARVAKLTSVLRERGCLPGDRVVLAAGRTLDSYVAILAIMRIGAIYMPLDPKAPAKRQEMIIDLARPRMVLSDDMDRINSKINIDVVHLTEQLYSDRSESDETSKAHQIDPEAPAYIIFTSGTTGTPKGVQVGHRALANLLDHFDNEFGFTHKDVVAAAAPFTFDMSILEIFLPLVRGGSIVLVPRSVAKDGYEIQQLLYANSVTWMQGTPTTWQLLIQADWPGSEKFVAITGGEATPSKLAKKLTERVGKLWNLYGPTEATVWVTSYLVENEVSEQERVPIGKPITNCEVSVREEDRSECERGKWGEIWLSGACLADGYVNAEEHDQEKFIWEGSSSSGVRWYKTGDIGRWRSDGQLEVSGRQDDQVKIRGYRIELGEVEAALLAVPKVKQAAVRKWETDHRGSHIFGYVVCDANGAPSEEVIKETISKRVPHYMVPQRIISVTELPVTSHGKISKEDLPLPQTLSDEIVNNSSGSEVDPNESRRVEDIWKKHLGVQQIETSDNFYDLGGTSLTAQAIAIDVTKLVGRRIRSSQVFRNPNLGEFINSLKEQESEDRRDQQGE